MSGWEPEPSFNQVEHLLQVVRDSNTRARRTGAILKSLWGIVREPETVGTILKDGGLDDFTLFYECLEAMSEMYHVLIETRASWVDAWGQVHTDQQNNVLKQMQLLMVILYKMYWQIEPALLADVPVLCLQFAMEVANIQPYINQLVRTGAWEATYVQECENKVYTLLNNLYVSWDLRVQKRAGQSEVTVRTLFSEDWIQTLEAYNTQSCNLSVEITKHRPIFQAVIDRYARNATALGRPGSRNFMTEVYNGQHDLDDALPHGEMSDNDEFRAYSGTAFCPDPPPQARRAHGDAFEDAGGLSHLVARLDIAPPRAGARAKIGEIGHMRRLLDAMGSV